MLKREIERLGELNRAVEQSIDEQTRALASGSRIRQALTSKGRFSMRPDFQKWKALGTRPRSDRGVTFHLQHKFVTKGRHASKGYTDMTAAAAHQAYIERPTAVERVGSEAWSELDLKPDSRTWFSAAANAGMDSTEPEFSAPRAVYCEGNLSFGTLGNSKADRVAFWRAVEAIEGRRGRVQCRIIAELPHELDQKQRLLLARDFCRVLEEKNLPYWCSIHAPSGRNDKRNYHLHIAYYDRPALRAKNGLWDFAVQKRVVAKNRRVVFARPYKQNKDRTAQGRQWIIHLRRHYADIANFHLSLTGVEKRYDPRSYKESGIAKQPTRHLGTNAAAAEVFGVATKRGTDNTRREVEFRLGLGDHLFAARDTWIDRAEKRLLALLSRAANLPGMQEAAALIASYKELSRAGRIAWRIREIHRIAREAVTIRLRDRKLFLEQESERLFLRPPRGREVEAWSLDEALRTELRHIQSAENDTREFATACARVAGAQARKLTAIERQQTTLGQSLLTLEKSMISDLARQLGRKEAELFDGALRNIDTELSIPPIPEISSASEGQQGETPASASIAELGRSVVEELRAPREATPEETKPATQKRAEDVVRELVADNPSSPAAPAPAPATRSPDAAPAPAPAETPEERALRALLGTAPTRRAIVSFPDAMEIAVDASTEAKRAFDRTLDGLSNRELRVRAFATRDAADLTEDQVRRQGFAAAFDRLREMARRRGLDLDTGRHDPAKASDRSYALLHTDSEISPGPGRQRERRQA